MPDNSHILNYDVNNYIKSNKYAWIFTQEIFDDVLTNL